VQVVFNAELLCNAAGYGWLNVVRFLVKEGGADVNLAMPDGATPLCHAALRCLVKEFGADINRAMPDGATPLYIASQDGLLAVVQCLVKEFGADVNQATEEGSTPLMTATAHKHTDIVVWLSKHGATAQILDQYGHTRRLTSQEKKAARPSRLRTWRRAHTVQTPAAPVRDSRSAPAA
jgi:ankyrin repeat protein